ncbi:MAG: hypothetical protein H8D23_19725 [Candidatus Brocadiales bacterium]|nr:hypothetical protein [Candidatus Brocadiales bacterium]
MARRIGTVKDFIALWQCHENLYYSIFSEALNRFVINEEQRNHEDAISEVLCIILNTLCFEHERDIIPPAWEPPIQPVINEEIKGGKVRKRPDFTCVFINSFADNPAMYAIPFHIECKRLGDTVGSWNLNKNYVNDGIKRFDSCTHEYGKRAPSGMMIGYIVSMVPTSILDKVNKHLPDKLPRLNFAFMRKVVSCEQELIRKNVKPERFKLIHLWTNLKN